MALLLAGTAAAIVVTQHLRDKGPVVSSIHLKRRPGPRYRACFRLTRDDRVRVAMVDAEDRAVRVLAEGPLAGSDASHCFDWDGRNAAGEPVVPGVYHLQLTLHRAGRTATSGERFVIAARRTHP